MSKPKLRDITVNSGGEICCGDDVIAGCVNMRDVARDFLSPEDFAIYALHQFNTKAYKRISALVEKSVPAAFARQEREAMSPAERKIIRKVSKLQAVNGERWRVYGGIRKGRAWARLTTEFTYFTDRDRPEQEIKAAAAATKAGIEVMDTLEHLDHYSPPQGRKGERLDTAERTPGEPQWAFGADHGRPETQVALYWKVFDRTPSQVKKFIRELTPQLDTIWHRYGVGVL